MKKTPNREVSWRPQRALVLSWLALLLLLALTVTVAYIPLGAANTVGALAIALLKGVVIATIFMSLRNEKPLTIVFAVAGFYWLGIMLWLAFADYTTRTNFPSTVHLL